MSTKNMLKTSTRFSLLLSVFVSFCLFSPSSAFFQIYRTTKSVFAYCNFLIFVLLRLNTRFLPASKAFSSHFICFNLFFFFLTAWIAQNECQKGGIRHFFFAFLQVLFCFFSDLCFIQFACLVQETNKRRKQTKDLHSFLWLSTLSSASVLCAVQHVSTKIQNKYYKLDKQNKTKVESEFHRKNLLQQATTKKTLPLR